jgi:hypothetical protein
MRRSITKVILRYPSYLTTDAPFDSRWDSISFTLSLCPYFSAPVCRRHMHALTTPCTGWLRYTASTDRDCPWLYSHDRLPLDILVLASSYGIACRVSHSTSLLCSRILFYVTINYYKYPCIWKRIHSEFFSVYGLDFVG